MKPVCRSRPLARVTGLPKRILLAGLLAATGALAQAPIPSGGGDPGQPPVDKILLDPAPIPAGGGDPAKPRIEPAPTPPEHAAPVTAKEDRKPPRKPHRKPRHKVVPAAGGEAGGTPKASSGGRY